MNLQARSFSNESIVVDPPYSLRFELYAVFPNAAKVRNLSNVSDFVCIYDSFNPGGSDNNDVRPPKPGPGVPPNHPQGVRRFYEYFPTGPDLWLAAIQTCPDSRRLHEELMASRPDRIHCFSELITKAHFGGNPDQDPSHPFHTFSRWIQEHVMPRLAISLDPQAGTLFPIAEHAVRHFEHDLNGDQKGLGSGHRALVNAFCDFKPKTEWKGQIAGSGTGAGIALWTEHWLNRPPFNQESQLASPLLVRLPPILLGGGQTVPAYQVGIELVANISSQASAEQRNKLGNVFMHVINCYVCLHNSP
jgi:hypothetical protein